MDAHMLFITTTRHRINKLPNDDCFHGHFQSTEKISSTYLDEYKLQYLFNKKLRMSKENAIDMNITHSVN